MHYTLNQLRIFLKVVEKLSITKASEDLHLTQPAVSIQMKNFQSQFDIPLIENIGKKIYITNFGQEIAKSCRIILEEVALVESRRMSYLGHTTGKLDISVVSTGKYVMPYFLSEFAKDYPGVEIAMDVTNKAMVVKSLEANQVDFSLMSVIPKGLPIEKITLMENKLFLVGKTKESNNGETLDINKMPLIYREQGSATRLAMEAYIKKNKIEVKQKMVLTSNEAVKQAILAGLGFSIMPLIGLRNELKNKEISIYPIKGLPIVTDWNLVWLKDKSLSPAAQAFKDYIIEHKNKITQNTFQWYKNL